MAAFKRSYVGTFLFVFALASLAGFLVVERAVEYEYTHHTCRAVRTAILAGKILTTLIALFMPISWLCLRLSSPALSLAYIGLVMLEWHLYEDSPRAKAFVGPSQRIDHNAILLVMVGSLRAVSHATIYTLIVELPLLGMFFPAKHAINAALCPFYDERFVICDDGDSGKVTIA